ncbi:MAG: PecA family PE domain-processing aspartic protease [Mycobacterium sp.]|uniref:PecA family PE domain-processing aspartic protease n=1 Tax=Mycobacterium sp. TaxID=1785 RepID=UPI003C70FA6F
MAGRDGKKQARSANVGRRLLVGMGASAGVFLAAAAMATGSAAPAKADFDALIDPIIQPILTSLTDSLTAFDPAAALDLTSWSDSFLASLNSIDLALPSVAEPAAAVAAAAEPAASTGASLPMTVLEGTEPAVYATIDGGSTSVPLLVDTGSSGLVLPYTDFGSNYLSQLEAIYALGTPTGISESGYSGGVDYIYLTYNNVPVDYVGGTGLSTDGPVDVEVYSWDPSNFGSLFSNDAFQSFLTSNQVDGILGIGENTAGPTTSPFESFGGVTVDVPGDKLLIGSDAPITGTTVSGAPISSLYETVTNGSTTTGASVSDDVDSGGVFGTIPSSLTAAPGTVITVYDHQGGTELYQYTVGSGEVPTSVTGTSIDSGFAPFLNHEIYINYATDQMTIGPAIS